MDFDLLDGALADRALITAPLDHYPIARFWRVAQFPGIYDVGVLPRPDALVDRVPDDLLKPLGEALKSRVW
jgi:hypothetical protein